MMKKGNIRIIGGQWRGHRLSFPTVPGLRPTPDRLRETLFNWLTPYLPDANCLDLFAGSGALGFEALSRHAKSAVFIDKSMRLTHYIQAQIRKFTIEDKACAYQATFPFKPACSLFKGLCFDIIFLDPPFHQGLIKPACTWLSEEGLLLPQSLVYIEKEYEAEAPLLPKTWEIIKATAIGQTSAILIKVKQT